MQDHGSRNKSTISSQHFPARVAMAATAVPSTRIPHAQAHLVASGVAGPGAVATRAAGRAAWSRWGLLSAGLPRSYCRRCAAQLDTLGIEPRASRMLSGCDTTTPRALTATFHRRGYQAEANATTPPTTTHTVPRLSGVAHRVRPHPSPASTHQTGPLTAVRCVHHTTPHRRAARVVRTETCAANGHAGD